MRNIKERKSFKMFVFFSFDLISSGFYISHSLCSMPSAGVSRHTLTYWSRPLQVVLINAVKDVAKALGNLISATKGAAGKPHDDPSMLQLKNCAKVGHMTRVQRTA